MKNFLLTTLALIVINQFIAQSDSIPAIKVRKAPDTSQVYMIAEQMPVFPGGEQALFQFLRSKITYPDSLKEKNIQGMVYLSFVIEKDGSITNIEAKRSPHLALTEESIRVLKLMPKWKPALQQEKPVRVRFVLPIRFNLK